jgi:hypothetical protein
MSDRRAGHHAIPIHLLLFPWARDQTVANLVIAGTIVQPGGKFCLFCKCEALSSNPSPTKKTKKKVIRGKLLEMGVLSVQCYVLMLHPNKKKKKKKIGLESINCLVSETPDTS